MSLKIPGSLTPTCQFHKYSTPLKANMDTQIAMHLPDHHFLVSMLVFGGVSILFLGFNVSQAMIIVSPVSGLNLDGYTWSNR